jgi:hypothetical protein
MCEDDVDDIGWKRTKRRHLRTEEAITVKKSLQWSEVEQCECFNVVFD